MTGGAPILGNLHSLKKCKLSMEQAKPFPRGNLACKPIYFCVSVRPWIINCDVVHWYCWWHVYFQHLDSGVCGDLLTLCWRSSSFSPDVCWTQVQHRRPAPWNPSCDVVGRCCSVVALDAHGRAVGLRRWTDWGRLQNMVSEVSVCQYGMEWLEALSVGTYRMSLTVEYGEKSANMI